MVAKSEITPEKARQILHDGTVNGKPITDQQRKYFGAIGGHLPAPGSKAKKSMQFIITNENLEKATPINGITPGGYRRVKKDQYVKVSDKEHGEHKANEEAKLPKDKEGNVDLFALLGQVQKEIPPEMQREMEKPVNMSVQVQGMMRSNSSASEIAEVLDDVGKGSTIKFQSITKYSTRDGTPAQEGETITIRKQKSGTWEIEVPKEKKHEWTKDLVRDSRGIAAMLINMKSMGDGKISAGPKPIPEPNAQEQSEKSLSSILEDWMEKAVTPVGGITPGGYKKVAEGEYVKPGEERSKASAGPKELPVLEDWPIGLAPIRNEAAFKGKAFTAGDVVDGKAPYKPGDALHPDHKDESSAWVIGDYPYGSMRTEMRVWIEADAKGKQQRIALQTKNPKTGRWNKPKKSTYSDALVGVFDEKGHIHNVGMSLPYRSGDQIPKFLAKWGGHLSPETRTNAELMANYDKLQGMGVSNSDAMLHAKKKWLADMKSRGVVAAMKEQGAAEKEAKSAKKAAKKGSPTGPATDPSLLGVGGEKLPTLGDLAGLSPKEFGAKFNDYFGKQKYAKMYKELAVQAASVNRNKLATQYKHLATAIKRAGLSVADGDLYSYAKPSFEKFKAHAQKHGTDHETMDKSMYNEYESLEDFLEKATAPGGKTKSGYTVKMVGGKRTYVKESGQDKKPVTPQISAPWSPHGAHLPSGGEVKVKSAVNSNVSGVGVAITTDGKIVMYHSKDYDNKGTISGDTKVLSGNKQDFYIAYTHYDDAALKELGISKAKVQQVNDMLVSFGRSGGSSGGTKEEAINAFLAAKKLFQTKPEEGKRYRDFAFSEKEVKQIEDAAKLADAHSPGAAKELRDGLKAVKERTGSGGASKVTPKEKSVLQAATKFKGVASGGSFASATQISKMVDKGLLKMSDTNTSLFVPTDKGKGAMDKSTTNEYESLEDFLEKATPIGGKTAKNYTVKMVNGKRTYVKDHPKAGISSGSSKLDLTSPEYRARLQAVVDKIGPMPGYYGVESQGPMSEYQQKIQDAAKKNPGLWNYMMELKANNKKEKQPVVHNFIPIPGSVLNGPNIRKLLASAQPGAQFKTEDKAANYSSMSTGSIYEKQPDGNWIHKFMRTARHYGVDKLDGREEEFDRTQSASSDKIVDKLTYYGSSPMNPTMNYLFSPGPGKTPTLLTKDSHLNTEAPDTWIQEEYDTENPDKEIVSRERNRRYGDHSYTKWLEDQYQSVKQWLNSSSPPRHSEHFTGTLASAYEKLAADSDKKYTPEAIAVFKERAKELRNVLNDPEIVLKSMGAVMSLEDFLEKAGGMPTGEPKFGAGEEQGGPLADVGRTSGSSDSAAGPAINAPGSKKEKLSDDDADDEGQMKPHTKPIEVTTRKSLFPADQLAMVAHERAIMTSRLQKSDDLCIGTDDHPLSVSQIHANSDESASELVKSNDFYHGGSPQLVIKQAMIGQGVLCKSVHPGGCDAVYTATLTACPDCGSGVVGHRAVPGQPVTAQGITITEGPTNGPGSLLRRPTSAPDLKIG